MKCVHCNGEHPDGFKFCPMTGKEIVVPYKACTNQECVDFGKHILPPDALFCPRCGIKIGSANKRIVREFSRDDDFSFLGQCAEGRISFSQGLKYGYMDINCEIVIPPIYDEVGTFVNGLAPVCENEKWGYINHNGELIIPLIYDYALDFSEGLACVWIGDYCGWINSTGKLVIDIKYDGSGDCINGEIMTTLDGGRLRIDTKGNKLADSYYSLTDSENYIILPDKRHIKVIYESNNHYFVRDEYTGLHGILDMKGNIVVPCIYRDIGAFDDNYAQTKNKEGWGLVDIITGEEVFKCEFKHWILPHNGHFYTNVDGGVVVYKKHWNDVMNTVEYLEAFSRDDIYLDQIQWINNYVVARGKSYRGSVGVIDSELKDILPFEYDEISVIKGTNRLVARKNNTYLLVSLV